MSEQDEMQAAASEAVEKAEAAATRRRWINLGEFVAVAGLLIAAIGLWLTWHDRQADEADRQSEKKAAALDKSRYETTAMVDKNNDLLVMRDERHPLGDVTVSFPSTLGVSTKTAPAQTIMFDWYKGALLKATDGGPDAQTGKLPVLITVEYFDDDERRTTTGIYDIVWQTKGGAVPLEGRSLKVVGMRLHERGGSQQRIDALWAVKPGK